MNKEGLVFSLFSCMDQLLANITRLNGQKRLPKLCENVCSAEFSGKLFSHGEKWRGYLGKEKREAKRKKRSSPARARILRIN